jgi:hypothetical protein
MTIEQPIARRGERDQFIPVRKADLLDALIEHGSLVGEAEREGFRRVCRFLAAIFHFEYFDELERLRHDYYYFNPERGLHARFDHAAIDAAYADLVESFTAVLEAANFVEMSHAEIDAAHRERKAMRVDVDAPLDDFHEVRFFRRGRHEKTVESDAWFGLRKRRHEITMLDDVILFVAIKPDEELTPQARHRLARCGIRPGSVLIKYFRNTPSTDIKALFPNARVVMSTFDKLFLGVKYQKELTDNIYFRNVNNNAGIFDYMIGAAEEQECKEAFLAYYFLRSAKSPPTQPELDRRIELWLRDTFGIAVDFEVDDALIKLERLGLLKRDRGGRLGVLAPAGTLSRLDEVWDNYFQFEVASPATAADA